MDKRCNHKWEKHWAVFEKEGTITKGNYTAYCSCGIFFSKDEFQNHLSAVQMKRLFYTSQQKKLGIHANSIKANVTTDTKDGVTTYNIHTDYVDYLYCTKCNERITCTDLPNK